MNTNAASKSHPVITEIIRRRNGGRQGDALTARSSGVKLGLVVEGGGMRGVYSGGALVAMERLGLNEAFDEVYGESAGAINACYFLARQAEFGIRIYFDDLTSLKFANPLRIGTMLNVNYVIDEVMKKVKPLVTARDFSPRDDALFSN